MCYRTYVDSTLIYTSAYQSFEVLHRRYERGHGLDGVAGQSEHLERLELAHAGGECVEFVVI